MKNNTKRKVNIVTSNLIITAIFLGICYFLANLFIPSHLVVAMIISTVIIIIIMTWLTSEQFTDLKYEEMRETTLKSIESGTFTEL